MKVALIHTRLLRRGGLESRLFNYMEWFVRQGHEVHVFVYKTGEEKAPKGVHVHLVPVRWIPKQFRAYFFDRKLRKLLPPLRFDFTLSLGRTSTQDAVLIPANHLGYLRALGKTRLGVSDRMQILMDRRAYDAPGVLFPCSEMMLGEAVELYGVSPKKCVVLFPPINTAKFNLGLRGEREALRKKFGFSPTHKSFVFVSASHSRKGLPLLLEAFALLERENVELVVAGSQPLPGKYSNVRHLGFVGDIHELYAAADGCLLPAHYEPFGQVVAESILCGTPVIVSGQVGAKSVVTPKTGRVVERMDAREWAKQILEVANASFEMDPDFAARFGLDIDSHMRQMLNAVSTTRKQGESTSAPT